jgi:hypothetical protein
MLVKTSSIVASIQELPHEPDQDHAAEPAPTQGYLKYGLYSRKSIFFHAFFKAYDLEMFKSRKENARILADILSGLIRYFIPIPGAWSIITTPKRAHAERLGYHFASEVLKITAEDTGIQFVEDVIGARNKNKLDPVFFLLKPVPSGPFILFDDIFTTGSTIYASLKLIRETTPINPLIIIGINNN